MQKAGNDFNLAYIPADFKVEPKESFDQEFMRQLFDRGYQDAAKGYQWDKVPRGMDSEGF
jgi:hypothetical protein